MNTIELLSSINQTVKSIADSMKPQNGSGAAATAKLSKGDVVKTADVNPAADTLKTNISKGSITEIVGVLNSLSPSIKNVASLSDKQIANFEKVIKAVVDAVTNLAQISEQNKKAIDSAKSITVLIDNLSSGIKKLPKFVVLAPLATLGIKMSGMVISALISVLNKMSDIKSVSDKVKKLNEMTKAIDSINKVVLKAAALFALCVGLGALVALGPTREILLLGFATLGAVMLTVTAIVLITGLAARAIKSVGAIDAINTIMNVVFKATLLIAVCMGLGFILANVATRDMLIAGLIVLGGVLITVTAIILLTGLAGKVIKSVGAFQALKDIMTLTLASVLLVALCFGLGMAIEAMGGWDPLFKGLITVGGTLIMLGAIFFLIGLVAKTALNAETLKGMGMVLLLTFGAMAVIVAAKFLGDMIVKDYASVLAGLGSVTGVMLALIGIGYLAGSVLGSAQQGILALGLMELMAVGAAGVVGAIMLLDHLKTEWGITWGDLYLDLLAIVGVIGAFALLGLGFTQIVGYVLPGIVALIPVEIMAAGAIGIAHLLVNLHKVKEDAGLSWIDLELDVLGLSLVLGTFGALAGVFGLIAAPVLLGSLALLPVELMTVGVIGIAHLLINLHNKAVESGVEFQELEKDVLWMSAIMGTFGVLAGAMALLIIPIAIGTPGMVAVAGFSALAIGVVSSIVNLSKAIDEAGGAEKLAKVLSNDIPMVLKNINSDNFSVDMSILKMLGLSAKYLVMAGLVTSVLTVVESISKIAQMVGIIDEQGRISPILKIDDNGNITYGEPVDLVNVSSLISGAVKSFVENCQYSFEDVKAMWNAAEIFNVLGMIVDPVAKFVDMLTGYKEAGDGMLAKVTIDEQGNVKVGQAVNIGEVSRLVANAVSIFVTELYKKENTEKWAEIIYGDRTFFEGLFGQTNKRADSVREIAGVLGVIMDPIVKFIDMVTSLEADGTGLSKIIVDKDGNVKSGTKVDVMKVATNVANVLTYFVEKIYGGLGKIDANASIVGTMNAEKLIKPLQNVVKLAQDLTNDNVNEEKINVNTAAIVNYMTSVGGTLLAFNAETLDPVIASLEKIITLSKGMTSVDGQKILVNSKNITTFMKDVVQKEYKTSTETVNKFAESITTLKKSFKNLDDVLIKDDAKRKKALDDFIKRVKELLTEMKEAKESMDSFNSMLDKTASYTSSPRNAVYQQPEPAQQTNLTPYAPATVNNDVNVNNNQGVSLTPDEIATAMKKALMDLKLTPTSQYTGDNIIEALKSLSFDVD